MSVDWCSCVWDDESAINRYERRRARKPYACDECHGPVAVGERYGHQAWLYPGDSWSTWRICAACADGPVDFCLRNCGCVEFGNVYQHLVDVFREYPFAKPGVRFRVGRMVIAMRRRSVAAHRKEAA